MGGERAQHTERLIHPHKRAEIIWKNSSGLQRTGYFAASVGFRTGRKLDESAEQLNALLFEAETAIEHGDADDAINAAIQFSEIVFKIRLFTPREKLPVGWQDVLSSWMRGRPMADIVASDPEFLVDFIEDVIVYRLVWAAEAVRVRSHSHQDEFADLWTGKFAESLEVGTLD